jgi:malonate semialdehyde decarboxylase
MPLVTIDLLAGRTGQDLRLIGDSVHQAMVEHLNVPQRDRFQAKSAFYARLAELLAERIELRSEDLAVILVENERTDWSFGRGQASYVVIPREEWR